MAEDKSGERDFDVGPSAEELFGDLPSDSPVLDPSTDESVDESRAAIDRSRVAFDDVDDQTAADVFEQLRVEVGGHNTSNDILDESPEEIIARLDEPDDEPHLDDDLFDEAAFEDLLLTGRRKERGFLWVDTNDDAPNESAGTVGDGRSPSPSAASGGPRPSPAASGGPRPSPASEAVANQSLADVASKLSTMREEVTNRDRRSQRTDADASTRDGTNSGAEGNAESSAEGHAESSVRDNAEASGRTDTNPSTEGHAESSMSDNAEASARGDGGAPSGKTPSSASTGDVPSAAAVTEPAADFSLASNADSQILEADLGEEDVKNAIGATSSVIYEDEAAATDSEGDSSSKSTGFFGGLKSTLL